MKIAIDAGYLNTKSPSGTHLYLYNLLLNLAKIDKENEYLVFYRLDEYFGSALIKKLIDEITKKENANFEFIGIENKMFWTQLHLARAVAYKKADVLFCPWQTIPFFHHKNLRVVGLFHDIKVKVRSLPANFLTYALSTKIIAVSETTKKDLLKTFKINRNIKVIYEGIDLTIFLENSSTDASKILSKYKINKPFALFIGTVVKRKNILNQIRAFAKTESMQNNNGMFVIAGYVKEQKEEINDLISRLNLSKEVLLIGRIPTEELVILLNESKFLSYVSHAEGFGLPVLEAQACGTPVLTSTHEVFNEICGETVLKADANDINDISNKMDLLFNDDNLSYTFIKLGLANITKYSWENCAKNVLACMENI